MIETYTIGGEALTYESLFNKSGPELVKLHNSLVADAERTRRFGDKTAAVKRTWAAIKAQGTGTTATAPAEPHHHHKPAKKAAAAKKEAAPKKKRGRRFVFPSGEELKAVRPGTHRHQLVMMTYQKGDTWNDGATFAQCVAQTWGKEEHMDEATQVKTTYEGLRLLHYFCGYGMEQDEEGRITLFFNGKKTQEGAILPKREKPVRHGG